MDDDEKEGNISNEVVDKIMSDDSEGEGGEVELDEDEEDEEKFFKGTFRVSDDSGLTEEEVTTLLGQFLEEKFGSVELEVNLEE